MSAEDEMGFPEGFEPIPPKPRHLVLTNHRLKAHPHWMNDIVSGRKTFEVRSTKDRCFQAGDTLELFYWDPQRSSGGEEPKVQAPGTGFFVEVIAVYHDLPGLQPGFCAMAIKPLSPVYAP